MQIGILILGFKCTFFYFAFKAFFHLSQRAYYNRDFENMPNTMVATLHTIPKAQFSSKKTTIHFLGAKI